MSNAAKVYRVRPGETVPTIAKRQYPQLNGEQLRKQLEKVHADNAWIGGTMAPPLSGGLLYLAGTADSTSSDLKWLTEINRIWRRANIRTRPLFDAMMPSALGAASGGVLGLNIGTNAVDRTFRSSKPLIRDIAEGYQAYKAGELTKGQYDYLRVKKLEQLKLRLGPAKRALFGSRSARQVLRIDRDGKVPTQTLLRNIRKMERIGKVASHGTLVLTAIDLDLSCDQIAETTDRHKKNDILVESLGNLIGGSVYGYALELILAPTPVGWVAALGIAAGAAAASLLTSRFLDLGYNLMSPNLDLVRVTRLDRVCR